MLHESSHVPSPRHDDEHPQLFPPQTIKHKTNAIYFQEPTNFNRDDLDEELHIEEKVLNDGSRCRHRPRADIFDEDDNNEEAKELE